MWIRKSVYQGLHQQIAALTEVDRKQTETINELREEVSKLRREVDILDIQNAKLVDVQHNLETMLNASRASAKLYKQEANKAKASAALLNARLELA